MTDKGNTENDAGFGLKARTLSLITDIFKNHPVVEEAVLYGSRAKGTHRPGSDIDIVLKGKNLDLKALNRIVLEIEELDLPYTFDVSIYHRIQDPELINHIKRVGKTLYAQNQQRHLPYHGDQREGARAQGQGARAKEQGPGAKVEEAEKGQQ